MARKPKVACTHKRCPNLVEAGQGGLCHEHQKKRHKWDNSIRSDGDIIKIYSTKKWKHVRKLALQRDLGWCVMCKERAASVVDHIKELKDGGSPYDLNNLQSLCDRCHAKKTQEVAKQRNL